MILIDLELDDSNRFNKVLNINKTFFYYKNLKYQSNKNVTITKLIVFSSVSKCKAMQIILITFDSYNILKIAHLIRDVGSI